MLMYFSNSLNFYGFIKGRIFPTHQKNFIFLREPFNFCYDFVARSDLNLKSPGSSTNHDNVDVDDESLLKMNGYFK